jgi:predicted nucleic acid-binding Zn ribbon protein
MFPRNDVNRSAKLARRLRRHQHNIVLDSAIDEKESLAPLKCHANWAELQHKNKKRASGWRALKIVLWPR